MIRWLLIHTAAGLLFLFAGSSVAQVSPEHAARMKEGTALFTKTVRPALEEHCLRCHGGEKIRADFSLATRETLLEGGETGTAIVPGKPDASFLMQLIRHQEEPEMPSKKPKLPDPLIAGIGRWIELGAPYDKPLVEGAAPTGPMRVTETDRQFWSFLPLGNPEPPAAKGAETAIDRFVFAKLGEANLSPNPPAGRSTAARRAFLDLTGLPPAPEQLNAFLADESPEAWPKLIDGLLDSPQYGERWARHWLDTARFAESHGFEQDYDRPHAFHYRDFVIKALNRDMPYDQFVRWQLAGDEIAPGDPLAMMATGFLGAGVFPTQLTEKEFESARYDELDDMLSTTGTAFLGLTIGCARCHDHKFDPFPAADYYRMLSTFTTTIRSEIDVDLDPEAFRKEKAAWESKNQELAAARERYEQGRAIQDRFAAWLDNVPEGDQPGGAWHVLEPDSITSKNGATFTRLPDGSILAGGKNAGDDQYKLMAATRVTGIRALRLETLTHESLPRKGPGRAGNGNFGLSHVKVLARPLGDGKAKPVEVKLVKAEATHQQDTGNLSVKASLDPKNRKAGWAVDKGGIGKDQAAVFTFEKPVGFPEGTALEIVLDFGVNGQHNIGRPRLSISGGETPVETGSGVPQLLSGAFAALAADGPDKLARPQRDALFRWYAAKSDPAWKQLDDAVFAHRSAEPQPKTTKVQVSSEGFPPTKHHADGRGFPHFYPETHFLKRGDPNQKEGVASQDFLQVLMRNGRDGSAWKTAPPKEARTSHRRKALADWMTDTENGAGHLLARVIVNRLWHHHFGRGIVTTPNDFGFQGEEPTHPELLDYLANRLIANDWKLKPIHREIMMSAAYRQSSEPSAEGAAIDPGNQWLWRFPPRRLEAEVVRDSMLAVSGLLDPTMFGKGTLNEAHQRRSIYFMIKRSRLVPMMQIFDQPEPLVSQGKRPRTTIAPQALLFMNNPQVISWAQALAGRIDSGSEDFDAAIRKGFEIVLNRAPRPAELAENRAFLEEQMASYGTENGSRARQLALADFCQVLFSLNEFVYLQ